MAREDSVWHGSLTDIYSSGVVIPKLIEDAFGSAFIRLSLSDMMFVKSRFGWLGGFSHLAAGVLRPIT